MELGNDSLNGYIKFTGQDVKGVNVKVTYSRRMEIKWFIYRCTG